MGLRVPMPGNGSRPSLSGNGLRASGMTVPLPIRRVAGGGERVLVLRDGRFASPQHEDFLRVAVRFGRECFPDRVALRVGFGLSSLTAVTLDCRVGEEQADQHGEDGQRPGDRAGDCIRSVGTGRCGKTSKTHIVARKCVCHGRQYAPAPEGVGKLASRFLNLFSRALDSFAGFLPGASEHCCIVTAPTCSPLYGDCRAGLTAGSDYFAVCAAAHWPRRWMAWRAWPSME
jgi:hypothetical protein